MGRVEAICTGVKKGERKSPQSRATFVAGHGIEGDGHAGPGHRQISILAAEDIETMRRNGLPDLAFGDFAENVVVAGVDLSALGLGSRLRLGAEAELGVTQLGKECHSRCAIYYQAGDCIMPRLGIFARVLRGGTVATGEAAEIVETVPRTHFQAVVLTISDRCARGEALDTAGPAAGRLLTSRLAVHIYAAKVVPDEPDEIARLLKHYSDGHSIDMIVTVGGTGFAPRDVTPEAVAKVIDRATPGLDEAMRRASQELTATAMLSRAVSGIRS
ncbi:MAG TPA: molybdopterin-binding protein, partial [Bryobacteraceae bacterium]|nr:molybdopterin-binding protein [Bryobacteraceae bacterium]